MRARRGPNSAQRDDVLYLRERQAEPATLLDKRQHTQDFGRIDAVPSGGAARGRQETAHFVEPERLPARATSRCHFSDEEPVRHAGRIGLPFGARSRGIAASSAGRRGRAVGRHVASESELAHGGRHLGVIDNDTER